VSIVSPLPDSVLTLHFLAILPSFGSVIVAVRVFLYIGSWGSGMIVSKCWGFIL